MPVVPMFPLEVAMLPGEELPLRVFEPRYTAMVSDCLATDDPAFGVVLIAAGREVGGGDARSDVGALAHIAECADFGDGRYRLRCVMSERIRVVEWQPDNPYPRAAVEFWPDEPGLVDSAVFDATRIHGPRQITDVYLLGLCQRNGGSLATFDTAIAAAAVAAPRPDLIRLL